MICFTFIYSNVTINDVILILVIEIKYCRSTTKIDPKILWYVG